MKAYVIGQPISHSLSPSIFRIIAETEQSSLAYTAVEVSPDQLPEFLENARNDDDFVGANVTIPHKEAILPLVDEMDDDVKAIGAGNVIHSGPRKIKAYNTDVIGIRKTLENEIFFLKEKTALILGAGGAAKAVAFVLGQEKAKTVYVYNPRSARGQELCAAMKKQFDHTQFHSVTDLAEIRFIPIDLVVNGTPIGMKGETSDFFDGLKNLSFADRALAFDLLYTPKDLLFLKVMRSIGINGVNGLGMLIEQALATWELWIGKIHDRPMLAQKLRINLKAILHCRQNSAPLFLTGFMGVGKSTIARELAHALSRNHFDTDRMIEERANATIAEIFARDGEARFRELEKEIIQLAVQKPNAVIALGGGALSQEVSLNSILSQGTLIYLKATEQTLFKRLKRKAQQRPLLADLPEDQLKDRIGELLEKRAPIYERAQLKVEIKPEDTPYDSAQTVLMALGEHA